MNDYNLSLISSVRNPARYYGGEYNSVDAAKPHDVSMCLCVPDSYEVGMSNLGTKILYHLFNSMDFVMCERCYAPWHDYARYIRANNMELSGLESGRPLKAFDFLGFSFQFELGYSNFFYMLDLAGIPYHSESRGDEWPIIAAGGPCAVNPEPMYKFIDFFFVGEGEDVWPDILRDYRDFTGSKEEFLLHLHMTYDCIYVPSLVMPVINDGRLTGFSGDKIIKKYKLKTLDNAFFPTKQIVPNIEVVHDRAVVELFRGCYNGCRFCQAGYIYRPVRLRSANEVIRLSKELCAEGGFDELSLNSLSTGDYSDLPCVLDGLREYLDSKSIGVTLPSLRLDSFDGRFIETGRGASVTFAPEAGTQRLRDVINKNITEEDIMSSVTKACTLGVSGIKLYFMIGLPTETMEDVEGIAALVTRIKDTCRLISKGIRINVSVSTFIPKPFTPFQWEAFDSLDNVRRKQELLYTLLRPAVSLAWHDLQCSLLEAVLARGGREIADSLLDAYKLGASFDAWSEHFNFNRYKQAFETNGVDYLAIVDAKGEDEVLPWDFISVGVDKHFLLTERQKAYAGRTTPACNRQCSGCGINKEGFCL